jgi:hypothetical protein
MMGKRHSSPDDAGSVTQTSAEVTAMLHSSDAELRHPLAVRDGTAAPVTCAACGCRLSATGDAWFHFNPLGGRDARGCRVACADAAHDAMGQPISVAV